MRRLIVIFMVMIFGTSLMAQPKQPRMGAGFPMFQIDMITKQLQLDDKQLEPFEALYKEYSERMRELQPKPHKMDREELSDEELERKILKSFDMVDRSNALKREYYHKFKEVISVQQIMKMYSVERRLRERMLSEAAHRLGSM